MRFKYVNLGEVKKFGFILAAMFFIIGCIQMLKGHERVFTWLLVFSAASFIISITLAKLLIPFYLVFSKIAYAIGWFNTRLILCIIFYCIITPIGLIMKLFRKDPLEKAIEKKKDSYWLKKEPTIEDVARYEKTF